MKTRQDYLNKKVTHEEYYGQFVTDNIKHKVEEVIGLERLLNNSSDKKLNAIPSSDWERVCGFVFGLKGELISRPKIKKELITKIHEAGDKVTPDTLILIYKEAGRQLINSMKGSK